MRRFRDRDDAGRQLGALLQTKGYVAPVVLGIPRGGVPVAAHVARVLGGQLGVVVARKLRAVHQPELAVGAVTADGVTWLNEPLIAQLGMTDAQIDRERVVQADEANRREQAFDGHRRPLLDGRNVIIVDDGIATGATALAAVRSVRKSGARQVVIAVPVAGSDALGLFRHEADAVICLREESDFWGIGEFYDDFSPVEDREVVRVLHAFERESAGSMAADPGGSEC